MMFLQPLKHIDFLPLLVSKTYHTLPLYCAAVLFFLDTSVRKQLRELLWESTVDVSLVARLKHCMSSLDENLKLAHPHVQVRGRGPQTTESISNLIFSIWKNRFSRIFMY